MERKREKGRFVQETVEEKAARQAGDRPVDYSAAPGVGRRARRDRAVKQGSLTDYQMRDFRKALNDKIAQAMPSILDAMAEKAKCGSVPHAQAFLRLARLEQARPAAKPLRRRGKGLAQRLLEEWRKPLVDEKPSEPVGTDFDSRFN